MGTEGVNTHLVDPTGMTIDYIQRGVLALKDQTTAWHGSNTPINTPKERQYAG